MRMHEAAELWEKLFVPPPLATDRGWSPDHAHNAAEDLRGAGREGGENGGGDGSVVEGLSPSDSF